MKTDVQFVELLQKALDVGGNTHSVGDVLAEIKLGSAQLWCEGDALLVTEITDYPQARVFRFWLAAGELQAILELSRRIYPWAKKQGCEKAVITGRKGWTEVLKAEEWAPTMVLYERTL